MTYPYSTTHFHCGCHIVERELGKISYHKCHYCEDTDKCQYSRLAFRRLKEWHVKSKEGGKSNAL